MTPTEIARDGGWVNWAEATGKLLQPPYRHHGVIGRSGPDIYLLPEWSDPDGATMGAGVPVGTVIWVHNRNGGAFAVLVEDSGAAISSSVAANSSSAFCMTAPDVWTRMVANAENGEGPSIPDGFVFELDLRRSQNDVSVLSEAVAAGYDGTVPAIVRVRVRTGVVIGSTHRLIPALDIGGDAPVAGVNWDAGSLIRIDLEGVIEGAGGAGGGGGVGGTGASTGIAGEDGGVALRAPIDVLIASTGAIRGGGGGGGGGNGSAGTPGLHGGAGGGGAGARSDASGYLFGGLGATAATGAVSGSNGTLTTGGVGGIGSIVGANFGGTGGNGGGPATAGSAGMTLNNGGAGSAGGAAGAAISRASGATVSFLAGAGGVVTGSTVVA